MLLITLFLKHSIFHEEERLEDRSLFKDGLGVWRHGSRGDTANVSVMSAACDKKHWLLVTTVEYLQTTTHYEQHFSQYQCTVTLHSLDFVTCYDND